MVGAFQYFFNALLSAISNDGFYFRLRFGKGNVRGLLFNVRGVFRTFQVNYV
jgi:hypothetical protein